MQDWERVRRIALATARAKGLSGDEAQDVAQDVVIALVRGRTDPSLWQDMERYVRSATGHQIDRFIAQKRRRLGRETRQAKDLMSKAPGPQEMLVALSEVVVSMDMLDADQKYLLGLVVVQGMTSRQIGLALAIRPDAVRKRLQRVREVIRMRVVVKGDE